jgi:hypothetical protein
MILIADSGSTKVSWRVLHEDGTTQVIQTIGINPFFVSEEDIVSTLEKDLKSAITSGSVKEVYFYGAGVAGQDKIDILCRSFQKVFPGCKAEAYSDLLAAARCLCGPRRQAAILGTGANTCFYDEKKLWTLCRLAATFWVTKARSRPRKEIHF